MSGGGKTAKARKMMTETPDAAELAARPHYFNRRGEPISLEEWARTHSDSRYRNVAQHQIRGWKVSTVWLGLDHAWHGPPQIFETMIFSPRGWDDEAELNNYQERHATEAEAEARHYEIIGMLVREMNAQPGFRLRITDEDDAWESNDAMRWRP